MSDPMKKRCGLLDCQDACDYVLEMHSAAGLVATMYVCLVHVPGGIGALQEAARKIGLKAVVYQSVIE